MNSGKVLAEVVHVGAENYASKISAEAKKHKKVHSEIMDTLNVIVKYVSIALPFVGAMLFCSQYYFFQGHFHGQFIPCVLSSVAAMIGMIPEGLILLTSTVLAVAVVRLSKANVLVQQLYCIETLARVDTLCLDKTGTITTGAMEVDAVEPIGQAAAAEVERALASLMAADDDPNETALAIMEYVKDKEAAVLPLVRRIPFSSDKKWSGAAFHGAAYVMGAGQFVMGDRYDCVAQRASELAAQARVLLLARVDGFTEDGAMVGAPQPLAFICIHDQIRATAAQTIQYCGQGGRGWR